MVINSIISIGVNVFPRNHYRNFYLLTLSPYSPFYHENTIITATQCTTYRRTTPQTYGIHFHTH